MRSPSGSPSGSPGRALVLAALVLALHLAAVTAKPPPPAGAPWAAYASKPGMAMRRSPLGEAGDSAEEPPAGPAAAGFAPGLAFNPLFGGPGAPLSPFLKLKPFLPAKPTFMPPVVDPSKFIDMKTSLLNSLFAGMGPAGPAGAGSLSARALFSPFAAPAASGDFSDLSPFAAPSAVVKPPPPAYLADLFKALNINKTVANASDTAAVPMGSPFAPSPLVDPSTIISTKAKFLSDLFASLSTTTPPPPPPPTEAAPTIVPPGFWLPASAGPGPVDPAAYGDKVATFLDKLFDSLKLGPPTAGKRSAAEPAGPAPSATEAPETLKYHLLQRAALMNMEEPEDEMEAAKGKRSAEPSSDDPITLLADAKGKVVDTIIGELAALKDSMVGAVSDLAQAQKVAAAAAAAAAAGPAKKPLSPFAAMWAKPAGKPGAPAAPATPTAPTIEPVLQRVTLLGQVFDMLTDMEKNITNAMVMPTSASTPGAVSTPATPVDLMATFKAKLDELMAQNSSTALVNRTASSAPEAPAAPKALRLVGAPPPGAGAPLDPTFWIPDSIAVGPEAYLAKTKEFLSNIMAEKATTSSPLTRRSYKWYEQQEEQKKASQQDQQQPPPSTQPQRLPQNRQDTIQNVRDQLVEFYRQNHHHHHQNRQPYWWN